MRTTADLAKEWASAGDQDAHQLVKYVEDLRAHDWRALVSGADDWPRFCREILGKDAEFIRSLEIGVAVLEGKATTVDEAVGAGQRAREIAERVAPLTEHGEIGNGRSRVDNVNSTAGGNHVEYLTARIARDRPDILERMKAGEFPSVRQAAIAAGIVKVPTLMDQAVKLWQRMSEAERQKFLQRIKDK